jgi:hypothetical protein
MDNYKYAILIGLCIFIAILCFALKPKKLFETPKTQHVETFQSCTDTMHDDFNEDVFLEKVPTCTSEGMKSSVSPMPSDQMYGDAGHRVLLNDNDDPVLGNTKVNNNFPKDTLNPEDLLPSKEATLWSQANPTGKGALEDKNFLHAAYHVGINTVGQSLRNANLQLRSEPPNPTKHVGPWMQSTIEPDLNRKPLEIGDAASEEY